MLEKHIISSESVTEGHPDKMCDQISDAILDSALSQDPDSRVAIETGIKNSHVMIFGEMTTDAEINIPNIARHTLKEIGYTKSDYGIEYETAAISVQVTEQSPDISQGVTAQTGLHKEQGAGDQGMMYGFACNETPELMPLPITLAHKLTKKLAHERKNGSSWIRPDGKSQVSVEYYEGKPKRLDTIVISTQHDSDISHESIEHEVTTKIINPVCREWIDNNTVFHVNPTGNFVRGGPYADAGLTGRKIIVDTYGGVGRHGGGAFSGKDPSKVDRSAAYAARYIAKNIVSAGLADKCEVQLAYAIGVANPVSVHVDSFGTSKLSEKELSELVREYFPLKPSDIVSSLDLKRPIYQKTASYGHFGRSESGFPWEKTDMAEILKKHYK
jgi:S-adenosylmethionine synthetase